MDAIRLLKAQHREVEDLFEHFDASEDDEVKRALFEEIADRLAIHASVEERFFYPAVCARQTERHVAVATDEHLEIKRRLVDAMSATEDRAFHGKVAALMAAVERHVAEEEDGLFASVKKLLEPEALAALGRTMKAEAAALQSAGAARKRVKVEIEAPAAQP
jgi:hemerythrin superfamily protein